MRSWKKLHVGLCLVALGAGLLLAGSAAAKGKRTLMVVAASSLTEFMADVEAVFEKAHPGVDLVCSLASSSVCRIQIEQGAPADLFLSADRENVDTLIASRTVKAARSRVFAHNKLAIMVGRQAKAKIKSLADLAAPGIALVLATPEAPIGKYTQQVLQKADRSGKYGKDFRNRVMASSRSSSGPLGS